LPASYLNRVMGSVADCLDAFSACLFVSGVSGSSLRLKAFHSLSDSVIPGAVIEEGQGFISWVMKNQKPIHVPRFNRDSRTLGFYRDDAGLKSLLAVPLPGKAGVISVDSRSRFAFLPKHERILRSLGEAVLELLEFKPDLVVSGINPGSNLGVNLNYSGTVAAAREACLYGITALAVSIDSFSPRWYSQAAKIARLIGEKAFEQGLAEGVFLNVNIPDLPWERIAGMAVSRQAIRPYRESFDKRHDPRKRVYYWQVCEAKPQYASEDEDGAVLDRGQVSITPVRCDTTAYPERKEIQAWGLDLVQKVP